MSLECPSPQVSKSAATFNKLEFKNALSKMSRLAENSLHKVDLHFHVDGCLEMKTLNEDNGKYCYAFLRAKEGFINGEFHYDYRYLLDYLKVLEEEDLVFEQWAKSCILLGPSGTMQFILRPILNPEEESKTEASPTSTPENPNQS